MAFPAEVYVYGIQIGLLLPIMIFVVLIINKVFIPVFYHNHIANCYEVSDWLFEEQQRVILISYSIQVSRDEVRQGSEKSDNGFVCTQRSSGDACDTLYPSFGAGPGDGYKPPCYQLGMRLCLCDLHDVGKIWNKGRIRRLFNIVFIFQRVESRQWFGQT